MLDVMAKRATTTLTDDLDGKPADETLTFSLDGRSYEIDLRKKNADSLRKALTPNVAAARKLSKAANP